MSRKKTFDLAEEEIALFREEMSGVTPLAQDRIEPYRQPPKPRLHQPKQITSNLEDELLPTAYGRPDSGLAPDDELFFSRSGIQKKLMRNLKRGALPIEARLDLHGLTQEEARKRLIHLIANAQADGKRAILVIHGKGYSSPDNVSVLKTRTNQWLKQHPEVLAFCSAQAQHGGRGAVYVLLRRS